MMLRAAKQLKVVWPRGLAAAARSIQMLLGCLLALTAGHLQHPQLRETAVHRCWRGERAFVVRLLPGASQLQPLHVVANGVEPASHRGICGALIRLSPLPRGSTGSGWRL
jgi:hypothetical protein